MAVHQAVIAATGLYIPPFSISNTELVEAFNAYVESFNAENATNLPSGLKAGDSGPSTTFSGIR